MKQSTKASPPISKATPPDQIQKPTVHPPSAAAVMSARFLMLVTAGGAAQTPAEDPPRGGPVGGPVQPMGRCSRPAGVP
ncbi:hypothetical protein GCM10009569_12460 [Arthrobacter russicus]